MTPGGPWNRTTWTSVGSMGPPITTGGAPPSTTTIPGAAAPGRGIGPGAGAGPFIGPGTVAGPGPGTGPGLVGPWARVAGHQNEADATARLSRRARPAVQPPARRFVPCRLISVNPNGWKMGAGVPAVASQDHRTPKSGRRVGIASPGRPLTPALSRGERG